MHRDGHVGVGLLLYAPLGLLLLVLGARDLAYVGAIASAGLAMLPDVDLRVPFLGHRGITHTVWFALAVGACCSLVGLAGGASRGVLDAIALSAFGGLLGTLVICSHLVADALTPMGVRPFAPVTDRYYSAHLTSASNPVANKLLLGAGVAGIVGVAVVGEALGTL